MPDIKIDVTTYAGCRGAERPKSFVFEGSAIGVLSVARMWVEEEHKTRARKRCFKVKGGDRRVYTLYHDLESGEWFLRSA